jgi:hypothetical protein
MVQIRARAGLIVEILTAGMRSMTFTARGVRALMGSMSMREHLLLSARYTHCLLHHHSLPPSLLYLHSISFAPSPAPSSIVTFSLPHSFPPSLQILNLILDLSLIDT